MGDSYSRLAAPASPRVDCHRRGHALDGGQRGQEETPAPVRTRCTRTRPTRVRASAPFARTGHRRPVGRRPLARSRPLPPSRSQRQPRGCRPLPRTHPPGSCVPLARRSLVVPRPLGTSHRQGRLEDASCTPHRLAATFTPDWVDTVALGPLASQATSSALKALARHLPYCSSELVLLLSCENKQRVLYCASPRRKKPL